MMRTPGRVLLTAAHSVSFPLSFSQRPMGVVTKMDKTVSLQQAIAVPSSLTCKATSPLEKYLGTSSTAQKLSLHQVHIDSTSTSTSTSTWPVLSCPDLNSISIAQEKKNRGTGLQNSRAGRSETRLFSQDPHSACLVTQASRSRSRQAQMQMQMQM